MLNSGKNFLFNQSVSLEFVLTNTNTFTTATTTTWEKKRLYANTSS